MTGVDRSSEYLEKAGGIAKTEGLDVEFVRDDMREFVRPDSFDAAMNLGGSFGYFDTPEEDCKMVKNIFNSLTSGGVFVLDTPGKENIARVYQEREWHEESGVFLLQERKIIGDWEGIEGRWIMFRDNKRYEAKTKVRLYSATELSTLLRECGFDTVKAYGSFEGTPYDTAARRLEVVARKA